MTRSCEVRVMRSAEAGQVIVRGSSEKATGELIDTETVTISSEGGPLEKGCKAPRWRPTLLHVQF